MNNDQSNVVIDTSVSTEGKGESWTNNSYKSIQTARQFLERGYSVIPLQSAGKTPVRSWKEFQQRKPTEVEISEWFEESQNNLGIVTGSISGIVVVDFDSEEAYGKYKEKGLLETPTVKTGRGYHCYFKYQPGIRNFQKRGDLQDIDLRAEGGYVVAPPSIHESGHQYHWIEGKGLDDLQLVALPEIFLAKEEEDTKLIRELYQGVKEGERNISLTRVVGSWANDGLTIQECIDMAQIWNSRNVPPLPDTELKRTVESIYEKHYSDRSHSPHTEMGLSERLDVDLVSVLQRGSDLQLLESDIKWSVDKLIPEQSITLLHGRGGIGKTWLSLILADAVSKRKPFMGLETRQSPVVVVDFENSLPVLIDRVKRIGIEDVLFWHTSNDQLKPPRLDSKQWQHYKDLPAGSLIIFDTVRAAQGQDENDSRQMAFILNRLKELRDLGFTIILLHHTTKGNERKYKGSTAILDLADQVLSLHKVKGGGMEEIAEDDEDDPDAVYRLGTKDKTRYEPFHTFLMFNAAKGFQVAPDPDTSTLESMYQLLEEKGRLNTNQFFEEVKEQLEIHGRGTFQRLLKKGIGNYWQAEKEGKANYYSIVPKSDIYSGDYETDAETPGDAVISAEGGSR